MHGYDGTHDTATVRCDWPSVVPVGVLCLGNWVFFHGSCHGDVAIGNYELSARTGDERFGDLVCGNCDFIRACRLLCGFAMETANTCGEVSERKAQTYVSACSRSLGH